jgi:hypothetical protein
MIFYQDLLAIGRKSDRPRICRRFINRDDLVTLGFPQTRRYTCIHPHRDLKLQAPYLHRDLKRQRRPIGCFYEEVNPSETDTQPDLNNHGTLLRQNTDPAIELQLR